MQITGKVKTIMKTVAVSASFKKRELVVTTDEKYPQELLVEFTQDKVDDLNGYNKGDIVEVEVNLRGRCWTNPQGEDKYFLTAQGWKINKVGGATAESPQSSEEETEEPPF